jgi:mannose-6-phosphate isomerase-like protein (cupin superfamily)
MESPQDIRHVGLEQALALGPPPVGNLAVPIFSHGALAVEFYAPRGVDPQQPHARDEFYFVVRGEGRFFNGSDRVSVSAGSCLFVPTGRAHRFEDFSEDFAVWVVFFGPEAGEEAGG